MKADIAIHRRPRLSPLRYPGGKSSLYPMLREIIRTNDLTSGTYIEPFAGGAGAALGLLITGQVNRIVINDLDPAIYSFWKAIVSDPQEFGRRIVDACLDVEEWRRQKAVYQRGGVEDAMSLGFATFYLNRTNRSGVLNAGPIGGMDQQGNYKIDARFNKSALLERTRLIGLHAHRITITNCDGIDLIAEHVNDRQAFIYADPPYFEKAGSLYLNSFAISDHQSLANQLNASPAANWMLTYDNVAQVHDFYSDRRRCLLPLSYSAYRVSKVNEIAVFSDSLVIPDSP